jgi:hypothetical protein
MAGRRVTGDASVASCFRRRSLFADPDKTFPMLFSALDMVNSYKGQLMDIRAFQKHTGLITTPITRPLISWLELGAELKVPGFDSRAITARFLRGLAHNRWKVFTTPTSADGKQKTTGPTPTPESKIVELKIHDGDGLRNLTEVLAHSVPVREGDVRLLHGTSLHAAKSVVRKINPRNFSDGGDFGRGFYTTPSETYTNHSSERDLRKRASPTEYPERQHKGSRDESLALAYRLAEVSVLESCTPAVVVFDVPECMLAEPTLQILDLRGDIAQWTEVVQKCMFGSSEDEEPDSVSRATLVIGPIHKASLAPEVKPSADMQYLFKSETEGLGLPAGYRVLENTTTTKYVVEVQFNSVEDLEAAFRKHFKTLGDDEEM